MSPRARSLVLGAALGATLPTESGRVGAGRLRRRAALLTVVTASVVAACGSAPPPPAPSAVLPQGGETVRLDPHDFTTQITNKYWPMKPGDRWVYEERDDKGAVRRAEASVLDRPEKVAGIDAVVVHDVVTQDGVPVEDTTDWYAQDSTGNIWYLGEKTTEFQNGRPNSTEGSWRAGVDGAQPGIAVPAAPKPGMSYRQEYLKGEAEDGAAVLSTDEQAQTPTGTYTGALLTRDTTPLEPELVELKWYAPGVGPVLTLTPAGGQTRSQLVESTHGG